jgi:hypothetical protein
MDSEKNRFVGPRKVMALVSDVAKTSLGNDIIAIMYEGGAKEIMTLKAFEALVTPEATDFTDVSKRRINLLVIEFLKIIAELDLKSGEVETLCRGLSNELMNSMNRASNFLWTGNDEQFVPGYDIMMDRSLLEADLIIKKIPNVKAEPTNKTE